MLVFRCMTVGSRLWMDECTQKEVRHLSNNNSVSGQNDGWCKCTIITLKTGQPGCWQRKQSGSTQLWTSFVLPSNQGRFLGNHAELLKGWRSILSLVQNNSVWLGERIKTKRMRQLLLKKSWKNSLYIHSTGSENRWEMWDWRSCLKPVCKRCKSPVCPHVLQGGEEGQVNWTGPRVSCKWMLKTLSHRHTWFRCCPVGFLVSPPPLPHHRQHHLSGTQPRRGSCRCCWEWAWCRSPAVLRWSSGWIGHLRWSGWWPGPNDRTSLRMRECVSETKVLMSANRKEEHAFARSEFHALMTSKPQTWSPNTMKVSLSILGEVEVNDHIDSLDVDTSGEEVCWERIRLNYLISSVTLWITWVRHRSQTQKLTGANQVSAQSIPEVVEHTVSVFLKNKQDIKCDRRNQQRQNIIDILSVNI